MVTFFWPVRPEYLRHYLAYIPKMLVQGQKVRLSALGFRFHRPSANYRLDHTHRNHRTGECRWKACAGSLDDNRTLSDPLPVSFLEAADEPASEL